MTSVTAIRSGSGKEAARPAACPSSLVSTLRASSSLTLLTPSQAGREEAEPQASRFTVLHLPQAPRQRVRLSAGARGAAQRPGGDFGAGGVAEIGRASCRERV